MNFRFYERVIYYAYMNSSREELGKKLRKARDDRKLTQADVATKAEITVNYYAMIERGEVNPSFEILNKLIKILKVNASEIFPS